MIRAVIFDFDGVILESTGIKTEAFRELFSQYPGDVDRIVKLHTDNPGVSRYEKFAKIYREYLSQPLDDSEVRRLDRLFSEIVYRSILDCPFVPGAPEFLRQASLRNKLFVASATPEAELQDIVARRGLTPFFVGVFGSPRTKTEIATGILLDHGFGPDEVVFVGDALSDLQAATNTGVRFVGRVAPGADNPFPASVADIVPSLDDLGQRWPSLLGSNFSLSQTLDQRSGVTT